MKIYNIIKNVLNSINAKKLLPAHSDEKEEINIGGIKIVYNGKRGKEIATCIEEEIKKHIDLYNVFLEDYDCICIGVSENQFRNPLIIEEPKWEKHFNIDEQKNLIIESFTKTVISGYSHPDPRSYFNIARDCYNKAYSKYTEDSFYSRIIDKDKDATGIEYTLCQLHDWKSLKTLLKSAGYENFIEEYINENIFTVLNKYIEFFYKSINLYTDRDNNNFFERNFYIIAEAADLTKGNLNLRDIILTALQAKNENPKSNSEYNVIIDSDTRIKLVIDVLNSIDPDGKLSEAFNNNMEAGNIELFEATKNEDAKVKLGSYYDQTDKKCKIQVTNQITDVPTIIHEFIHQYYENRIKVGCYSKEIPSVFFQKVAIDYLINNGYGECKNVLEDMFSSRKENDAFNNWSYINKIIDIIKVKYDKGEITLDNILDNDCATDAQKREFAKSLIDVFANRDIESNSLFIQCCSYSLGTYFAEKFSKDEDTIKRMFKLISDPNYSLQSLIDDSIKGERKEPDGNDRYTKHEELK